MTRREAYALLFEPLYGWRDDATLSAEFAIYEELREKHGEVTASDLAARFGATTAPSLEDVVKWLGGIYEEKQNSQVILHCAPNHRGVQVAYFQPPEDSVLVSAPLWIGAEHARMPIEAAARLLLSTLSPVRP